MSPRRARKVRVHPHNSPAGGGETYGPRPTPKGHAYMSFRWVLPLASYQQSTGAAAAPKKWEGAHPLTDGKSASVLAKFADCHF